MTKNFKINKTNSVDLAFAESCLMAGSLSQKEFKQWLYYVIEHTDIDKLPTYIFDIMELEDLREIFKGANGPIGFDAFSDLSDIEENAIDGIAYKRGFYDHPLNYDIHISREDALKALTASPHIEDRFRETFPFIDY